MLKLTIELRRDEYVVTEPSASENTGVILGSFSSLDKALNYMKRIMKTEVKCRKMREQVRKELDEEKDE